jgi:DNA modification methylase
MRDVFGGELRKTETGVLKRKFGIIPFSVLDTKTSEWTKRKKSWLDLGINSELGRDDDLLGFTKLHSTGKERLLKDMGTSVFDPVLCELMYDWFCPNEAYILDPFAGGSVRGIVANYKGHKYTGIELRKEQVEANNQQGNDILIDNVPNWICDDSDSMLDLIDDEYDFVFTCPPYFDLEVYSDDPNDISNMDYDSFHDKYKSILCKSADKLKNNRFFCIVLGDVRRFPRDSNWYRNLLGHTKQIMMDKGLHLYNELILLNHQGGAGMRVDLAMKKRKIVKVHQNVLVFYKGDSVHDIPEDFDYIEEDLPTTDITNEFFKY